MKQKSQGWFLPIGNLKGKKIDGVHISMLNHLRTWFPLYINHMEMSIKDSPKTLEENLTNMVDGKGMMQLKSDH